MEWEKTDLWKWNFLEGWVKNGRSNQGQKKRCPWHPLTEFC